MVDRTLAALAAPFPNRKFDATRRAYLDLGFASSTDDLNRLVRQNIDFTFSYYLRLARLRQAAYRKRLIATMRFTGTDVLHDAARERRGVILLSAHLGDFDAAGVWIAAELGITPVVTTPPVPSRGRQYFFDDVRRSCGVVVRRQEATRLTHLRRDLEAGRLVLMMLDRKAVGPMRPLRFFNRTIDAPAAAWRLAAITGAAIVPGACWRSDSGTTVLWCGNGRVFKGDEAQSWQDAQAMADQLTDVIRCSPYQLHIPATLEQLSWTVPADHRASRPRERGLRRAA
ncbi:MAG: phosphatidylinositol dimannoside acyltransferase [Solirubrobacteraceae bacterium]